MIYICPKLKDWKCFGGNLVIKLKVIIENGNVNSKEIRKFRKINMNMNINMIKRL
jgi:deoxyribose-phosphate aldolase